MSIDAIKEFNARRQTRFVDHFWILSSHPSQITIAPLFFFTAGCAKMVLKMIHLAILVLNVVGPKAAVLGARAGSPYTSLCIPFAEYIFTLASETLVPRYIISRTSKLLLHPPLPLTTFLVIPLEHDYHPRSCQRRKALYILGFFRLRGRQQK
jgi:hypothetical protein